MAIFTLCICKNRLVNILLCKDKKIRGTNTGTLRVPRTLLRQEMPLEHLWCSRGMTTRQLPLLYRKEGAYGSETPLRGLNLEHLWCSEGNLGSPYLLFIGIAVLRIIHSIPVFFTVITDITPLPVIFLRNCAFFLCF